MVGHYPRLSISHGLSQLNLSLMPSYSVRAAHTDFGGSSVKAIS